MSEYISYGYIADVMQTVYYWDMYVFGMVPTWHLGILRDCCSHYFMGMFFIFNTVREYHWIFPHLLHVSFIVDAVSASYQMYTPIINISTSYWLSSPGNSYCLVMRLGSTGSPFT